MVVIAALAASASLAGSASAATICCGSWGIPDDIAISPDGKFAYAAASSASLGTGPYAMIAFARDPDTGALSPIDTYSVLGGPIVITPDGKSVYVAWAGPSARVTAFSRDTQTGLLTEVGTWRGPDDAYYYDFVGSRDGRQLYLADGQRDAITILDRDLPTGSLSYHGELRSGDPGVEDFAFPHHLALSDDDRFLYVGAGDRVTTLRRSTDGSLSWAAVNLTCRCGYGTLALAPDGRHLFGGGPDLNALERDPDTGALATDPVTAGAELEVQWLAVPIPDGSGVWALETGSGIREYTFGPDGFTLKRTYRDGVGGDVWGVPKDLVVSPDGLNVYATAVTPSPDGSRGQPPGRVIAFRRDPETNKLTFVENFVGPEYNGQVFDSQTPEGRAPVVTINGGDEFTNDPDVEFTLANLNDFTASLSFEASGDGSFASGVQRLDYIDEDEPYPWTLDTTGPERVARTVYARVSEPMGSVVVSDDIVLDTHAPAVNAARVVRPRKAHARPTLLLSAEDRVSGVARMQVTRHRGRPGAWRPFARSVPAPPGRAPLWVRLRDRAGNKSKWHRAAA